MSDREAQEKSAGSGGGFQLTADGKVMLVPSGGGGKIRKAGAGDERRTSQADAGLDRSCSEWRQLVVDAWRIQRDHFYDPGLRCRLGCGPAGLSSAGRSGATREDVSHIIGEMIAELNVGHAYYYGGDVEGQPSMNVGMLGLNGGGGGRSVRYRTSSAGGGDWDVDTRGPLREPGVDLGEGDIVLAVNGVPMRLDRVRPSWAMLEQPWS